MKKRTAVLSLVAVFAVTLVAYAAVIFDPATGTGFVGKGDTQLVYGWNNAQLQANAGLVQFRGVSVTELSWECTNTNNQRIQERERVTTTQGVLSKIDRVRNQITGFILVGYAGPPTLTTEGPKMNSCPSGPWVLTSPAGDPVLVNAGVQVSIDGTNWIDL